MGIARHVLAASICAATIGPLAADQIYGVAGTRAVVVVHQDYFVEKTGGAVCGDARQSQIDNAEHEHNRFRAQRGLKPFSQNAVLSRLAAAHACDMAKRGTVTHKDASGLRAGQRASMAGYQWRRIGENVGARANTVNEVIAAWIASPGHRANIMDRRMREFGLGSARSADGKTVYWTALYAEPKR